MSTLGNDLVKRSALTKTREYVFQVLLIHYTIAIMINKRKSFPELLDLRRLEQGKNARRFASLPRLLRLGQLRGCGCRGDVWGE